MDILKAVFELFGDCTQDGKNIYIGKNLITSTQLADATAKATINKNTPVVPSAITKVQAMKQLKALSKWTTFKTVLATNQDAQDEWDLATELQRANPFVAMLAPALNMTNAELDTMFINASKL